MITSPSLISLVLPHITCESAEDHRKLLCVVCARFHASLRSIKFGPGLWHLSGDVDMDDDRDLHAVDLVEPLLSLHDIKSVDLCFRNRFEHVAFTDDDAEIPASSWPKIEQLSCRCVHDILHPVPRFDGLLSSARHCPHLESLDLHRIALLRATDTPWPPAFKHSLRFLRVRYSRYYVNHHTDEETARPADLPAVFPPSRDCLSF
ncbi:hypothetical protein OBBRIDRAFT_798218 [Obba rivulosa]|uniref:F-box domain-containing protein n=1 Tax=Obba rivulosa TaxID=1052685 RepID=A0A8E2DH18_9APHY|nr:hypothetical protein OBBRIDRAFT_798218 [Obba rivulosa]